MRRRLAVLCDVFNSSLTPSDGESAPAMIRPLFIELGLFLTPFALYALYVWATQEGVLNVDAWSVPRLISLSISALVLVIISFVLLAQFGGAPPGSTYVPAHMENGRLVPGAEK